MLKIFKYSLYDLLRSRWLLIYFLFFLVATFLLFYFSSSFSKAVASLMSVEISIVPLVSVIFGVMYYYNSREFIELLLAQPMPRKRIFLGLYGGLSISLSICFLLGSGLPFLYYGFRFQDFSSFMWYLSTGVMLTMIFSSIAFFIALLNENRIRGFGLAILVWLYMVIIFDSIFLFFLVMFQDYPLEKVTLVFTLLNPVDLSRVLVLLNLEISALMGYSGAVFNEFFGTVAGMSVALGALLLWVFIPLWGLLRVAKKKNF
jgi:Cu-processing system permease protein